MNSNKDEFKNLFLLEIQRRLFKEGVTRLKKCLAQLTEEEIWHRPNANSNSMGNITLHLCGNVRQWVIAGLGGAKDIRHRQQEFDEKGPIPVEKMLQDLDALMEEVEELLNQTSAEDLLKTYSVQGFRESGISILVHVTEHFSYHVGQMTYYVKLVKDMDMGFYAGKNLNALSGE